MTSTQYSSGSIIKAMYFILPSDMRFYHDTPFASKYSHAVWISSTDTASYASILVSVNQIAPCSRSLT